MIFAEIYFSRVKFRAFKRREKIARDGRAKNCQVSDDIIETLSRWSSAEEFIGKDILWILDNFLPPSSLPIVSPPSQSTRKERHSFRSDWKTFSYLADFNRICITREFRRRRFKIGSLRESFLYRRIREFRIGENTSRVDKIYANPLPPSKNLSANSFCGRIDCSRNVCASHFKMLYRTFLESDQRNYRQMKISFFVTQRNYDIVGIVTRKYDLDSLCFLRF